MQYYPDPSSDDWSLALWQRHITEGLVGLGGRWDSKMYQSHRERLTGFFIPPLNATYVCLCALLPWLHPSRALSWRLSCPGEAFHAWHFVCALCGCVRVCVCLR